MYAELSDFFYVWLKRTAGYLYPEFFRRHLTDKENEAVANKAKFQGAKGAGALAERDYQERMASIFAECRRVLKTDGIMTVMFTHKQTSAWDALTKGLMQAGFVITASWPVNTESEGGLHIKNKAAAKSTIFLACRPRSDNRESGESVYWEDIEPHVARAVRNRVIEFQDAGISGVDLYLASFGPALEEFSRHWPLKRGTPRQKPEQLRRRRQQVLFEEEWDPYAATPEDALDTARREVKRWRVNQLTQLPANVDLDPTTAFFVLAWDTFHAPVFAYDEALGLSRAVGVNLERDIVGRLAEKKSSNLRLWDSAQRAAKGSLGPADGSRGMIDALHHAANAARSRWSHAPEVLGLSRRGGIGLLDIGYLALPAALVQAMAASVALILLPLLALRRARSGARYGPTLAGFFCIGLAFLLIEIAFIGRFTIILSHPVHALVVVLAAFLLFAGVGSYLSARRGPGASIAGPVIGIAAVATTYALLSSHITAALVGAPPAVKIAAAFALIAPLATLMGMPFPRALARLNAVDPSLLPWAWGINGCASVIGAVLATLLAIHIGHTVVILSGVVLYLVAGVCAGRMAPRRESA